MHFRPNQLVLLFAALTAPFSGALQTSAQITVRASLDGQNDNQGGSLFAPPDANAAVGPNHIVSWGNDSFTITRKDGTFLSSQGATAFFGFSTGGDGHVIYDEISGRFALEVLSTNASVGFAVSDTSDPTGPWHKINIPVPGLWDGYGGNGIGYNADAYVVHVNGFNNQYAVIAASNNVNLAYSLISAPGGVRIGRPAPMAGATTDGPFYFVEGNDDGINGQGGTPGTIEVLKISNILSGSPTYTDYQVSTTSGGASVINVSWRNNLLAVTGFGPAGGVNWFLLSTSNGASLLQSGTIVPDNNAGADVPSIAVAPDGSLGVNYTAADNANVTTMYAAGRLAADPPGMMRAPRAIINGPTTDGRWGDYSSCVVDINSSGVPQNSFWACNEYLNSPGMFNWTDRIASFSLDSTYNLGFEFAHLAPGSFRYNPGGEAWTFNSFSGGGSGLIANGSGFGNPNAPEGVQAAFVQTYGLIAQTLSGFTPGIVYTITYSAAQRSGGNQHGGESWNVNIDNSTIRSNTPGPTSYTTYTATFTASASTHKLSFVGTDLAGGDNTVFLDNVVISPALNPTPPSVAVTSPSTGAVFVALATINLSASVTTNGNRINGVQFFADGLYVGQVANAPFNYALVNVNEGVHNVVARLNFNDGSSVDSAPVSCYVINRNPNYGFEVPSLGSGNYSYTPAGALWNFSGQSGIAANGSGFGNPNAPEGTQAALLQNHGSFSQVLSGFTPGTNYTITYSATQRSGTAQHGGETWNLMIDSNVIQSNTPGAIIYSTYSTTFTASAATHVLSFVGTDLVGGDNTVFIDNVTINPPVSPPVLKLMPILTQDTLPATATTIVGDWITFTAAFSNAPTANYQWQFVNGGVITDIPGATNSTLTINSLQLTNTGFYRLEAINATNSQGVAYSSASPLTINNLPAAVTNVITAFSAQTGLGSAQTTFVPGWTVAPGSLIAGLSPSSVGTGNFSQDGAGGVAVLTDGTAGSLRYAPGAGGSSTEVTCGGNGGQSVTYTLPASAGGYTLTNIVVYGGWGDAGRDQQAYTVYYSTVAAPTNFIQLSVVNYNPVNNSAVQSATRASLTAAAGALATNVAAVLFDFTSPAGENGYSGYSEIAVYGTAQSPVVVTNTLPVTAADVVGSQVTFTAGINGQSPMSYQWRKISGGATNNIPGATNSTLTLANLQLTNTASYQLLASNAYGVALSAPSALTVSSIPTAVNNVITEFAAQTGPGPADTLGLTFTPTWTVTTNNSLIAGRSPSATNGNFTLEIPGRSVNSLTAGGSQTITLVNGTSGYTTSTNYVTCGNGSGAGSSVTYTLTGSVSGYNLTNIMVYGGWGDAGRDQQAYTVSYSSVATPATFVSLGSVNYNPVNAGSVPSATRATLLPLTGVLAARVASVRFDFTSPASENGYCGYSQIVLSGTPAPQPVQWAVGNGNWDTNTSNWRLLSGGATVSYVENNLASFDDGSSGSSPITVTLTGNHSPSILTNNSAKDYILTGNFSITSASLIKNGAGTLLLANGGANAFSSIAINTGTLQVGNGDTGGSLGPASVTNNGVLAFNRLDTLTISNRISGSGSLVQNGSGTLVLRATNGYSGATSVNAGTLALVEPGSIPASALISVASGATLDVTGRTDQTLTLAVGQTLKGGGSVKGNLNAQPGSMINPGDTIGLLNVQGNVVLNGGLILELNRTNVPAADELVSTAGTITGGGALTVTNLGSPLQAGDKFQLFNQSVSGFATLNLPLLGAGLGWANNLGQNGTLAVVSTEAPMLTSQLTTGNSLSLTWPAGHSGWRLQAQTNNVSQGLGTNWSDVPGSTLTNQMTIPINKTDGSVFYRLTYP
jgi:autotransporter-associated beta strand protein